MKKHIHFAEDVKQFNVNEEAFTPEELDKQVNPYLSETNKKLLSEIQNHNPQDIIKTPKELSQDNGEPKKIRVARPLRHVQYKPVKEVTYNSNKIFPKLPNYSKIKLPLKPNTIIVSVKYFAINPIDLKIYNYYTSDLTGAMKGFGREFSGEVYETGSDVTEFQVGDTVCGLYYHLFGKGCSASHILLDLNKDAVVKVDNETLSYTSYEKLASWSYNYLTALQIIDSISSGGLNSNSSVLINGASTDTGMQVIQILKNVFHVTNIAGICSGSAGEFVQDLGCEVIIDYKKEYELLGAVIALIENGKKIMQDRNGNEVEVAYPNKKFDLIVDLVGGSLLINNHSKILKEKTGYYITLVGDKKADYKKKGEFIYKANYNLGLQNLTRSSVTGINYRYVEFTSGDVKSQVSLLKQGLQMIKNSQLEVKVNSVFKFNQIDKALDKMKTQHAFGTIVVEGEDF